MTDGSILIASCGSWASSLLARDLRRRGYTVFVADHSHEAINWVTTLRDCGHGLRVVVLTGGFSPEDMGALAGAMPKDGGTPSLLVLGDRGKVPGTEIIDESARVAFMPAGRDIHTVAAAVGKLIAAGGEQRSV